jgi:hypothetical protein
MAEIVANEVRYIKLGAGGAWAAISIERGEMHFGYRTIPHELCAAGDWDAVIRQLTKEGRKPGKAKDAAREIRDFYTLGTDALWITFADGHLWWAFSDPVITWLGADEDGRGARMRRTIDGWHKTDLIGQPLRIDSLSSKLTQVAAYRQTLCRVSAEEYLLRRLNGIEEPILIHAREARAAVVQIARTMIEGLHWADFETLVDLILARGGWRRASKVGEGLTDVDIILEQPTTGERAFVQVKSRANRATLNDYVERFRRSGGYDRMFFVCHSPKGPLAEDEIRQVHVWEGDRLAEVAIGAGLFDWLMERTR